MPLWIVLLLSAAAIFVFMLFFADSAERAFVQATMMGGVAVVISSTLLLLWFLDNPYHAGLGGLRPVAMERGIRILDQETAVVGRAHDPVRRARDPAWRLRRQPSLVLPTWPKADVMREDARPRERALLGRLWAPSLRAETLRTRSSTHPVQDPGRCTPTLEVGGLTLPLARRSGVGARSRGGASSPAYELVNAAQVVAGTTTTRTTHTFRTKSPEERPSEHVRPTQRLQDPGRQVANH